MLAYSEFRLKDLIYKLKIKIVDILKSLLFWHDSTILYVYIFCTSKQAFLTYFFKFIGQYVFFPWFLTKCLSLDLLHKKFRELRSPQNYARLFSLYILYRYIARSTIDQHFLCERTHVTWRGKKFACVPPRAANILRRVENYRKVIELTLDVCSRAQTAPRLSSFAWSMGTKLSLPESVIDT